MSSAHPGRSRRFIPVLLVLVGVVVLLYPVVATLYNNQAQQSLAQRYGELVQQEEPAKLSSEIRAARRYNRTLSGTPILDPWTFEEEAATKDRGYRAYLRQLDLFSAMATVRVPSAGIDLPVYHGTSDEVISRGVGHLYGTSLPVGGRGSHAVVTSHSGLTQATLFDRLNEVRVGDEMFVSVADEVLAYRVDDIEIVLPDQIDSLRAVAGKDQLTLFTCHPYSVNSHRLLVTGHRIPYVAEDDVAVSNVSVRELPLWMWALVAAAFAAMALVAFLLRRSRRVPAGDSGDVSLTAPAGERT